MAGYTLDDNVTLKNIVGATNSADLARREETFTRFRISQIAEGHGPQGHFDLDHFKAIHHHIFQDVYEWAGKTRDQRVILTDGDVAVSPYIRKIEGKDFAIGPQVTRGLRDVFDRLQATDNLAALSLEEFAGQAAVFFAEINSIHAFREGNGRTQRAFFSELGKAAGHPLAFAAVSRTRMEDVSIAAHERGDVSGLERMFREIGDPERVGALRKAQDFLDRSNFAWRDRYMSTTEPGQTYNLTFVGQSGNDFMARTENAIIIGRARDLPEPTPTSGERFTMTTATERQSDKFAGELNALSELITKAAASLDPELRTTFLDRTDHYLKTVTMKAAIQRVADQAAHATTEQAKQTETAPTPIPAAAADSEQATRTPSTAEDQRAALRTEQEQLAKEMRQETSPQHESKGQKMR